MASELKRQRGVIFRRLKRIEEFIRNLDPQTELALYYIQERLYVIDECWQKYNSIQTGIDTDEGSNKEEEEETRATFQGMCIDARTKLHYILRQMQEQQEQGRPVACNGQALFEEQQQHDVRSPSYESSSSDANVKNELIENAGMPRPAHHALQPSGDDKGSTEQVQSPAKSEQITSVQQQDATIDVSKKHGSGCLRSDFTNMNDMPTTVNHE